MSTVLFTFFCIIYSAVMVLTFCRYIISAIQCETTTDMVINVIVGVFSLLTLMAAPWVFSQMF